MRFPNTECCYECGEPMFDLEQVNGDWLCLLCIKDNKEKEKDMDLCPVCNDEMTDSHSNYQPTWSDYYDNTVCWLCSTQHNGKENENENK